MAYAMLQNVASQDLPMRGTPRRGWRGVPERSKVDQCGYWGAPIEACPPEVAKKYAPAPKNAVSTACDVARRRKFFQLWMEGEGRLVLSDGMVVEVDGRWLIIRVDQSIGWTKWYAVHYESPKQIYYRCCYSEYALFDLLGSRQLRKVTDQEQLDRMEGSD